MREVRPTLTLLEERTLLSQPGTWAAVAPLPTARVYLGAATGNDGTIYAVGGDIGGAGDFATNEVYAYNPQTNTWTTVAPHPTAREALAVVSDNGLIYAIGGSSGGAGVSESEVDAYNPQTNTWTVEAPLPTARAFLAAAVGSNGIIYAIGGNTNNSDDASATNEVDAYNPATNVWTVVASLPTSRSSLAAATGKDGTIYAIGGNNSEGTTSEVDAYNPATNAWTQVASVPTYVGSIGIGDAGTAVTGNDGTIYAFSNGWGDPEVDTYNPTTNTWTRIADHLYSAYGLAATTGLDGTIYVMGGYAQNYIAENEVDAYTPIPINLTVTTLADDPSGSIPGYTTLRDAITEANEATAATPTNQEVINFAPGLQGTIDLTSALPDLGNNISIEGPGASSLTVQRDSAALPFSVFTVDSGETVTVCGMTIAGSDDGNGGGVVNDGTLTVNNSTFTDNSGNGGIYNNSGTLTVNNSTFTDNSDGIYNYAGTTTVVNSAFTSNGTGIANTNTNTNIGLLTVTDSTFINNSSGDFGGGISNGYTVVDGEGVYGATATVTNCTFTGDSAYIGGGISNYGDTLTVSNSTFANDTADYGGGISTYGGTLILTNSTFAGNTADVLGGGVYNGYSTMPVTNCTFIGNSAPAGYGGGIWGQGDSTLNNTIVAGNIGDDIDGQVNPTSSNNLIGDGSGITNLSELDSSNLIGTAADPINPLLGPLADYGGPTQTMALLPGSPAIGAGSPALIPTGITTDQRGEPRIVNGTVDIGAFESQGFTLTPVTGSTPQGTPVNSPFANPLAVIVTANNPLEPVAGGIVTFSAPATGASAILSISSPVTIGSNGQASVTSTANAIGGEYTVSASTAGAAAPAAFVLTNQFLSQTISFGPLAGQTYGVAPITLDATDTSGLTVSYMVVSGPATISDNLLTITGAGNVDVEASQPGNATYSAAAKVDESFTVAPASLTITPRAGQSMVYGGCGADADLFRERFRQRRSRIAADRRWARQPPRPAWPATISSRWVP